MGAARAADRQVHQIRHIGPDSGVDQGDLVADLAVAGPIAHERLVTASEPRPQRSGVIEVDAHDLDLDVTESGVSRRRVAGQYPYLRAVTHKRLSQ